MVITYYLAIEKAPFLKDIFPSFASYLLVMAVIVIPLLVIVGYVHYKRSNAYASEADITVEANPYYFKLPPGHAKDVQYPVFVEILNSFLKMSNNEKFSEEDKKRIGHLIEQMNHLINGGTVGTTKNSSFNVFLGPDLHMFFPKIISWHIHNSFLHRIL